MLWNILRSPPTRNISGNFAIPKWTLLGSLKGTFRRYSCVRLRYYNRFLLKERKKFHNRLKTFLSCYEIWLPWATEVNNVVSESKGEKTVTLVIQILDLLIYVQSVKSRHQYFRFFLEKSCQYRDYRAGTGLKRKPR